MLTRSDQEELINLLRLELAASRFRDESATPVTTIALDVGYSSSQYFARKFQQRYGVSPCQWRRDGTTGSEYNRSLRLLSKLRMTALIPILS